MPDYKKSAFSCTTMTGHRIIVDKKGANLAGKTLIRRNRLTCPVPETSFMHAGA